LAVLVMADWLLRVAGGASGRGHCPWGCGDV
jgi:hypothetical protein